MRHADDERRRGARGGRARRLGQRVERRDRGGVGVGVGDDAKRRRAIAQTLAGNHLESNHLDQRRVAARAGIERRKHAGFGRGDGIGRVTIPSRVAGGDSEPWERRADAAVARRDRERAAPTFARIKKNRRRGRRRAGIGGEDDHLRARARCHVEDQTRRVETAFAVAVLSVVPVASLVPFSSVRDAGTRVVVSSSGRVGGGENDDDGARTRASRGEKHAVRGDRFRRPYAAAAASAAAVDARDNPRDVRVGVGERVFGGGVEERDGARGGFGGREHLVRSVDDDALGGGGEERERVLGARGVEPTLIGGCAIDGRRHPPGSTLRLGGGGGRGDGDGGEGKIGPPAAARESRGGGAQAEWRPRGVRGGVRRGDDRIAESAERSHERDGREVVVKRVEVLDV